jgi:hypothetical protein
MQDYDSWDESFESETKKFKKTKDRNAIMQEVDR